MGSSPCAGVSLSCAAFVGIMCEANRKSIEAGRPSTRKSSRIVYVVVVERVRSLGSKTRLKEELISTTNYEQRIQFTREIMDRKKCMHLHQIERYQ